MVFLKEVTFDMEMGTENSLPDPHDLTQQCECTPIQAVMLSMG